jgi:hypothetical protein
LHLSQDGAIGCIKVEGLERTVCHLNVCHASYKSINTQQLVVESVEQQYSGQQHPGQLLGLLSEHEPNQCLLLLCPLLLVVRIVRVVFVVVVFLRFNSCRR